MTEAALVPGQASASRASWTRGKVSLQFLLANPQRLGGLIIFAIGVIVAALSWITYPLGQARAMGPGYFPFSVGLAAIGVGFVLAIIPSLDSKLEDKLEKRSLLFVSLGMIAFALGVSTLGIFLAAFITVLITSYASRQSALRSRLALSGGAAVVAQLVFVEFLGLPFAKLLDAIKWII